jgi:pimeloyl-ACP methyl ester carboxylesterase
MMEKKTININHKIISYTVTGSGNPVMLLHGFGEDTTVLQNQIEILQKNYLLMLPDIPGSGASDLTNDVSMEAIAEMIQQIALAEKIKKFVLIGHSMGGYATLAFAEKYSEILSGFGLFHSTAYADTEEKKSTRRKGIEFINQHGSKAFLNTTTPNLFSEFTKEKNPQLIQSFLQSIPNFSNDALTAYYKAMIARPDRTAVLKNTILPVLFIIGEQDKAVPFEDSVKQSAFSEKIFVHILKNTAHMGMLEETEKANKALLEFLEAVFKN